MEPLESERLIYRPHERGDLEAFVAMEMDAGVRRYVGGEPRTRAEAEKRFLNGLPHALEELSLRAVVLKADGSYVGRAGLYPHVGSEGPVPREASISYYLATPFWGQGLATEAGAFFVERGFRVLGLDRIVTTIDARHEASRRVLQKLGFRLYSVETGLRSFEKYELRRS
jgi:RimJ/RimL family protein N-acetyltransferase